MKWFEDLTLWKDLKSFIYYKKSIVNLVTKKQTVEQRFYISNLTDVVEYGHAIKGDWQNKNLLRWHLDATFWEDDNTIFDKNAFNNFSTMNKMVLGLLKLSKPVLKRNSISGMRKQFSWAIRSSLSKVLNFFTDEELLECLSTTNK